MRSRSDSFDTALLSAVKTAFLDSAYPSEEGYRPQDVTNDRRRGRNVLSVVKRELSTCESFDLCVAFVAESGLQMLVQVLSELRDRGIKGRILTSTYLNFNSPAVFGKLLEYGNITTRVYQGSLHAKGYVFESDGAATVILGSSNLTQTALACNKEWNILFRSHENGEMIHAIRSEFDGLWDSVESVDLTAEWIDSYGATVANTGWFHLRLRGRLKPCPGPRCLHVIESRHSAQRHAEERARSAFRAPSTPRAACTVRFGDGDRENIPLCFRCAGYGACPYPLSRTSQTYLIGIHEKLFPPSGRRLLVWPV